MRIDYCCTVHAMRGSAPALQTEIYILLIRKEKLEILLVKGGGTVTEFFCKTKVLSGAGAVAGLKELGSKKLLLVSDPYFAQNGTAQRIAGVSGAQTEIFDKVTPDPSVELVAEGVAKVRDFCPDTVVALGGGSAMDCAKAMAYFAGGDIRLVMIPTTSGSGSEVTNFSVLTHGDGKHPLIDSRMQPDVSRQVLL